MADVVAAARALAADLLAPAAGAVDAAGALPRGHLDALAAAGLYGLTGPRSSGGLGGDVAAVAAVVEELAAGDLATTFVWLQHLGVVVRVAAHGPPPVRARLADLCAGRLRAGIALQAAVRPGPPAIRVRADGGDLVLDGAVPWVTGWGAVDVVLVAARDGEEVVFVLADAVEGPTLAVAPQRMVAVQASATVELRLAGHRVPAGRLVHRAPLAGLLAADAATLRVNGSLALGLALRCTRLIGPSPLDDDLAAARARLDAAAPEELPDARGEAAALAHRAAGALVVATGSGAVRAGSAAERTVREAVFLLVFGSRPAIRASLLSRLGAGG
ncbi:alkylation response protein AidB-like acyl-CoA dehydrogenase [Geodermatophilus bullaregiensis]|uniref:acyl-CoA dehydrogenase family protein n=1 Tax=Geodermatophilus bullaregiensis TaxID=1564160 RepID=UPI0019577820|nr:acyl-CoA dehydrogenase family protein [Geodermatophilus bullaregiensis]MBM7804268.1 alkylation response protein AidB-like acyl-CoA dehydrogenase [Geodermatophilus bullaregiensis]